ncbi:dehydrogenase/reductase SDR family member 11 isoform X3 [Megachile rotundata]|uniref:dehydrogenase/reductase SDR family member 11 isoform X3 n=1 Tax=Megachile rotundata TaxID=143995 RepID=UPI0006152B1E|nr:PREDICTED: dehydrogenase/reductase SDR family member 11-like isoform X7 [Megachile rotundata]
MKQPEGFSGGTANVSVYVDDGLIAASDEGLIDTFFLELDANYVSTPIEVGWDASDFIKDSCHGVPYREVVDSLMFLQTVSGPDISFAVNIASRVLDKPTKAHWLLVKRIIRYLKDTPTAEYYKTIETNVIAPTICAREFLQSIKKRNTCGHIVNINSIAGHFAEAIHVPVGMYAASKYAVTALCSELRHEIIAANLNVKVTSISPGLVRTEMVQDFIANLDVRTLEPEDIADSAIYAIGTPERVEIHEITIIPHGTPIVDLNSSLQTKQ